MATSRGYGYFAFRPGKSLWRLNGTVLEFRGTVARSSPPRIARIPTVAGTVVHQNRFYGRDMPCNLATQELQVSATMANEDDYFALLGAVAAGRAAQLFVGGHIPQVDVWSIAALNGATAVRTSRPVAYNGSSVTHSSHPPAAYVDGVLDATITAAIPSTASGDAWESVDVTGIAGSFLEIRYAAAPYCILAVNESVSDFNALLVSVSALDDPIGVYTTLD